MAPQLSNKFLGLRLSNAKHSGFNKETVNTNNRNILHLFLELLDVNGYIQPNFLALNSLLNSRPSILIDQHKNKFSSNAVLSMITVLIIYQRYTNADLKISLYICVQIKITTRKFRILNPKNYRII